MLKVDIVKRLEGVTLTASFCADKERMALLGASGCGKSMTLKCIAGVEKPDEGHIELDGRVLYDSTARIDLTPQKRRVGYLFQQYALFPNMTVKQNILAGACMLPKQEREKAAAEKLRMLRLEELQNKKPHQLSGGQQQRVALARILVNDPAALLLDEPFSALDSYLRWQLELELSDILAHYEHPMLYVSHSRDEVYRLCDTVCVMNRGTTQPKQTVKDMFTTPLTHAACLLSGCKNFTHATCGGTDTVICSDWHTTLRTTMPVPTDTAWVGVRAHFLREALPNDKENMLAVRVERIIDDVFSTVVIFRVKDGADNEQTMIRLECPKGTLAHLTHGCETALFIPPEAVMALTE